MITMFKYAIIANDYQESAKLVSKIAKTLQNYGLAEDIVNPEYVLLLVGMVPYYALLMSSKILLMKFILLLSSLDHWGFMLIMMRKHIFEQLMQLLMIQRGFGKCPY